MSAPQLADANTSSEWFRTVGDEPHTERERASQATRRQRFTRLVTYTMAGLLGFTLLGLASFAWRQHEQRTQLAAPVPLAAAAEAEPAPTPPAVVAATAETPPAAATPEAPKSVAVAKPRTTVVSKAKRHSPFLSSLKQPAKLAR